MKSIYYLNRKQIYRTLHTRLLTWVGGLIKLDGTKERGKPEKEKGLYIQKHVYNHIYAFMKSYVYVWVK